ncbi:hypothetical protein PMLGA01_040015300, partial [Plasmodium malariae]
TVVKLGLKNFNDLNYINIYENNNIKNILRNNELLLQNSSDKNKDLKFGKRENAHVNSSSHNFVDVILLTVDTLPNNIKYTYGKLVRLMGKQAYTNNLVVQVPQ